MTKKRELESWWEGLDEEQRVSARKASGQGRLDDGTRRSLADAGLVTGSELSDDEVVVFLKTRH